MRRAGGGPVEARNFESWEATEEEQAMGPKAGGDGWAVVLVDADEGLPQPLTVVKNTEGPCN